MQQVVHPIGVGAQERVGVAQSARGVETQGDRLLDLGEQLFRAGRQRELVVLGQVEAQPAQSKAAVDVERHEQDDRQHDAGDGELVAIERLHASLTFTPPS